MRPDPQVTPQPRLAFEGFITAAIAYNATAATLQTRLRALPSIGSGGCSVAGAGGGPYTVTFTGNRAKQAVGLITLYSNALTGDGDEDVDIAETTPGVTATHRGAPTGSRLVDTTNGVYYINAGTALEPTWTALATV